MRFAPQSLPAALPLIVVAWAVLTPGSLEAQAQWTNDIRLSYEYDDNVGEDIVNEVRARVARVTWKSDFMLDDSTRGQLSAAYHGGFKRYFDVTRDSLEIANQFIHEGQLDYRRRFGRNVVELSAGVKHRTWQDETFFFVNEDGFTRLWGGLSARRNLSPTLAGEIVAQLSGIDFEHVDDAFGYNAQAARLVLSKRFSSAVQGELSYGLDQRRYDGRGKLGGPDDDPINVLAPDRRRQVDLAQEAGVGLSFVGPFGFQGRYRFRLNNSNSFGFDYVSHIFNIQLAQQLPWRLFAQFYGAVELRNFEDPIRGLVGTLDIEDTDNNVMVFRLLKELNHHVDVEARYGRYRNESINLNAFYTKNIYSLGFRFRP
jgi:hypothetical protein